MMAGLWAPRDWLRDIDSEDFQQSADQIIGTVMPAIDAAKSQATDAIQSTAQAGAQAYQQAATSLPKFTIPSISSLTAGWGDSTSQPSTATDQLDTTSTGVEASTTSSQPAASPLSRFTIPTMSSLLSGWEAPKPPESVEFTPSEAEGPAPSGAATVSAPGMPTATPSGQPAAPVALPDRLDTSSRDANLRQWAPALQDVERRTGLRADALAAIIQAENGGGQSPLSANDQNYFSITAVPGRPNQAGVRQGGRFAHYNSPQDSLNDFVDLISTNPRYADAWANRGDPQKFFQGLVKGGYIVPEPGFPVETWLQNLDTGRQHFNQIAPTPAPTAPSNIPGPDLSPNGTPITAPTSQRSGGLDVNGIVQRYQGVPYTFGGPGGRGQGLGAPTDCSGFVAAVYQNQYGLSLVPHTDGAYNQLRQAGAAEVATKDARPGDVVFYLGAGTGGAITHHMGIYAGDGKVLDDSVSGADGVHVRDVGHAGQYVILRDPRLNQQAPQTASVPPPIQPAGVAEASGGERPTPQEMKVWRQQANDNPTSPTPSVVASASSSSTAAPSASPTSQSRPLSQDASTLIPSSAAASSQTLSPSASDTAAGNLSSADQPTMYRQPLGMPTLRAPTGETSSPDDGGPVLPGARIGVDYPSQRTSPYQPALGSEGEDITINQLPGGTGNGQPPPRPYRPGPYDDTLQVGAEDMYRQPLGMPTAGPDTTDVGSPAGPPVRDDYATAGSSVPAAVPSAQAIPQEDPTAIPRPAYVPPAMPLVAAPEPSPAPTPPSVSGPRFNPLAGQTQPPQPGELPPRNAPPPSAPLLSQPAPTPASSTAPYNPLANQPPAQPGELPARPGVVEPTPVSEVGAVGAYTRGNAPPPAVPDVVQAVNRGETVNPFHWANQVSDAAADQVVQSVGIDPESAQGIASKFVVSAVVNPINWEGGAFSATAEAAARAGLPFLRAALPAIAERFGAETAGRVSTWLASQGSELAANVAGQAAAGAVTNPEAPGFGAAFGGGTAAVLGPAGRVIGRGVGAVGSELRAGAERAATVEAERAGQAGSASAYGSLGVVPPAGEGSTIGRGGAPMEKPSVWTTSNTTVFDPEYPAPGLLESTGVPPTSPRRLTPDTPLYHLTSSDQLERIADSGLTPAVGDVRPAEVFLPDGSRATRRPGVYAADNAGILSTVDRDVYGESVDWSLLRFTRGNRRWARDPEFAAPGSWVTRNTIPPSDIEVFNGSEWVPVGAVRSQTGPTAIEPPGRSSTTSGTLGTVPPEVSPDRLASVNRALSQGVASAVSGGVGAATNQQLNPDDPNAALKGFAVGAVAPFALSRGARALASRAGAEAGRTEGALAALGDVPGRTPRRGAIPEGARPITSTEAQDVARLRLEKFPPELRGVIQDAAQATDFAHAQRRGVLPDAAAEGLADDITRSVDQWIKQGKAGKVLNTEETRALRNVVTGQAQKVADLAQQVTEADSAGVATNLLIVQAHAEAEKLAGLVQYVEGARAEAGRSLRAWRAEPRPTDPNAAAQQIFKKFGTGPEARQRAIDALGEFQQIPKDDPIAMANFWARIERGGITSTDVLTAIRYNSMLSSPRTWEVGWIGSMLQAPFKAASDVLAATTRPTSGELPLAARGAVVGFQRGLRPLLETITQGITSEQAAGGALPRGLAPRATSALGRVVGTAIDLPGRMTAAPDALFSSIFREAELGRQAGIQAYRQGLKGEERSQFLLDFMTHPPKSADEQITRTVDRMMLRGDMGTFGNVVQSFGRNVPGGELYKSLILPFMKVAYHVWTQGVEMTPLGAAGTALDVGRGALGRGPYAEGFGAEQAASHVRPLAERLRYNAMGLGVTGFALGQAYAGNISAAGPSDPGQKAMLRSQGWQPYSVKVGGTWYGYSNWGPVSVPLASAGAIAENQQYRKPDATPEKDMLDMTARVGKLVGDQSFISGIGTLVNAYQEPDRYLPQFLANMATSFVPYGSALNVAGQATDPTQRRPERVADVGPIEFGKQAVEARLPGLRQNVPAAQDVLGRPIPNDQTGASALEPFRFSNQRADPTIQAFTTAGVNIPAPHQQIVMSGAKLDLTPAEQRRWNEVRGEMLIRLAGPVAQSGALNRMPPVTRERMLQNYLSTAAQQADTRVFAEMPDRTQRLRDAISAKLRPAS